MTKTKNYILASILFLTMPVIQEPSLVTEDTTIETGNVNIEAQIENNVNTNITETENIQEESKKNQEEMEDAGDAIGKEDNQEEVINDETSSAEIQNENEDEAESEKKVELENENKNEVEMENNVEANGESGENTAKSEESASIDTGDVNIVVGVLNTANSNFTGSDFSQFLLNISEGLEGDINLEDKIKDNSLQLCTECLNLDVINHNEGIIENNLNIEGSSGSNLAESKSGNAKIKTGDVNAVANIFNLLNTNFIGSNWQSFIVNVFDNWTGDLVLPGKSKMQQILDSLSNQNCNNCGILANNSSKGEIENEVSIKTNTGDNVELGNPTVTRTGTSNAQSSVLNIANTNITGGSYFFIIVNDFGDWKGNIFSLPSELEISSGEDSIKIYNADLDDKLEPLIDNGKTNVVNDNSGLIKNSVVVNLSSGSNTAISSGGQTEIETGDTNAFVNLLNILNTNIIGSNWLLGIVNTFGKWTGNIAFGKPDLWMGSSAATPSNPGKPGENIVYTLTYTNNGDADATGVVLRDNFDQENLTITDAGGGVVLENPGEIEWNIGTVLAGSSGSVSYSASVRPDVDYGYTYINSQSEIQSNEKDWDNENNIDNISVEIYRSLPMFPSSVESVKGSVLQIDKNHDDEDGLIKAGDSVNYQIAIYNNSSAQLYNVVVEDILINEDTGIFFNEDSWNLGEVFPFEKILIDYRVDFGSDVPLGSYKNMAKATGTDFTGNEVYSPLAFKFIEVQMSKSQEESILNSLQQQINTIKEEVNRMLEPLTAPIEIENSSDKSDQILSEKEDNLPIEDQVISIEKDKGKEYAKNFLAAIGIVPLNSDLIFVFLFVIISTIFSLWLINKKETDIY